jgi:hypothetical protein
MAAGVTLAALSNRLIGKNVKRIPIAAAKRISKEYDVPIVIVFAIDPATNAQHVTTFGDTIVNCAAAARGGNELKKHLGWPEGQCNAEPARVRRKRVKVAVSGTTGPR